MNGTVLQWHEAPWLVQLARSSGGRFLIWALASGLIFRNDYVTDAKLMPLVAVVGLGLIMILPSGKRWILSVSSGLVILDRLFIDHGENSVEFFGSGVVVLLLLFGLYHGLRHLQSLPSLISRRPVLWLHATLWSVMSLSLVPALAVLIQFGPVTWQVSYLARYAARGQLKTTGFKDHLFYLMPAWGTFSGPAGKGLDYLSRHEASDPENLARAQLAGIKLLILSLIWIEVSIWLNTVVFIPENGLVRPGELLPSGELPTWYLGWASVYLHLVLSVFSIAAIGHLVVGCLRLFGFNVFRSTYKPLLAESIIDFWGRFNYYFKEVLVDFFFYPTYLRLTGVNPMFRLLLAVFAAAFIGNIYFHLVSDAPRVIALDTAYLWSKWGTRTIYCLLLALGVWLSMLRQQSRRKQKESATWWLRLRRIAGVWTFFAIINIWNSRSLDYGTGDAFRYLFSLFGIG